jgi:hypothetical protein
MAALLANGSSLSSLHDGEDKSLRGLIRDQDADVAVTLARALGLVVLDGALERLEADLR